MSKSILGSLSWIAASVLLLNVLQARIALAQNDLLIGEDTLSTIETSEPLVSWGNLGGVSVDRLGFIYVANFSDRVWRITPEGDVTTLSTSLYGASGNAVDSRGRLLQSNFYANTISRISRDGRTETLIDQGLSGPVGIATDPDDNFYVTNCSANSIAFVSASGEVRTFADGSLFSCPNSIVRMPDGGLYVANFNNEHIIRIDSSGSPSIFVSLPAPGNAHLTFARGHLYVTKIISNALYRVSLDGQMTAVIASSTNPGHDDGPASAATLSRPNGIAVSPSGQELYINTLRGGWQSGKKTGILLRKVKLLTFTEILNRAAKGDDVDQFESAYRSYKSSELGASDQTVGEAIGLGFQFLNQVRVGLAVRLFELNAASYPDVPAAWYNLGEAYRYTGQTDKARRAYERTLELDSTHQAAQNRLGSLAP